MPEVKVMGPDGDASVVWNPEDSKSVANAKRTFKDLTGRGYNAYRAEPGGEPGEKISQFDPSAGRIIIIPPIAGG